jgi:hypothetical protein
VADYGAVGDAVQLYVNCTSNSVVVTTTNTLSWPASSNKTVELFGVGTFTTPTNNQDLIAIITNVVNGTNAYISGDIPQVTSNGVYCIYGTQNAPAFQAAVNAASGTNTIINIPAGTYLLIPPQQYTNFIYDPDSNNHQYIRDNCGIQIYKGGLHFVGAGMTNTILMADGAFKNQGYTCMRGNVFTAWGPITNDYPLVWDSLTFDGGLQTGLIGSQGIQPANWQNGVGWDGWSAAGLDGGSEPLNTFKEFVNCKFQHFRGEMIKGITGSAQNETILVTNCVFLDGNATAFNYNFAHTITSCTFSNMYQVEEFYLAYPTNAGSYFINNYTTNITHNLVSLNGGTLTNQPYVISNNLLYCNMNGNAIATGPASSVLIASNQFIEVTNPQAYTIAICIGQNGAQPGSPDAFNTNIVIAGNTFTNEFLLYVYEAGGTSSTDQGRAANVQVFGNNFGSYADSLSIFSEDGWSTNVHCFSNSVGIGTGSPNFPNGFYRGSFGSGAHGSQYALVDTNNLYYHQISGSGTNSISYATGSRYEVPSPNFTAGMTYALSDTDSNQIPAGAQILILNDTGVYGWTPGNIPVFLNSACTGRQVIITNGTAATFSWSGSQWTQDGWIDTRARVHW